ncbi:hypothetical protein [Legionella sp. PC997]|uniref:hypothetical protein n=1 Tax=Legionella sp. PC997 TaxID=2755562 RepID=UPI0015F94283|nr:hypothetical protein [Legionella sp. PC997]QMT60891.1 hypothetical protein HBNCFIEN_02280 [Legionella sp. PC997]
MARFPNKTAFELRQYFKSLDLPQLIKINREYGPHFISIEDRIDQHKATIKILSERLSKLKENQRAHELTFEKVVEAEAGFQQTLKGVLCDTDQTDRYLGRQAAGFSPLTSYEHHALTLLTEIAQTSDRVSGLNQCIADLEQRKTAAVSELKILNKVIEEKRRALRIEPMFACKPN